MIGTGSKSKAMFYAGITGFAEPLGACIGWLMFGDDSSATSDNKIMFGWLFGITAGIMTEVAVKSLLLESARYDPTDKIVSKAWIFGALVIGLSLIVIDATAPDQSNCAQNQALTEALGETDCTMKNLEHLCPLYEEL